MAFGGVKSDAVARALEPAFGAAAPLGSGAGGHGGGAMRDSGPLGRVGLALLLMATGAGARPRPAAPGDQPRYNVVLVACDSLVSDWGVEGHLDR